MKVCVASDYGPYEKGQKFLYTIDKTETWDGSYYKITYSIHSMKTKTYLLGLDEKRFHKYFLDLEVHRENTIKQLLK